jgi:hypothetical protein
MGSHAVGCVKVGKDQNDVKILHCNEALRREVGGKKGNLTHSSGDEVILHSSLET